MSLVALSQEVETIVPACIHILQEVRAIARNDGSTAPARYLALTALVGEIYAELAGMNVGHFDESTVSDRVPTELVKTVESAVRIIVAISRHRDRLTRECALDEISAALFRARQG